MEVVMRDLFGSLGGLLSLFIILFIVAMPAGLVFAVRAFEKQKAREAGQDADSVLGQH